MIEQPEELLIRKIRKMPTCDLLRIAGDETIKQYCNGEPYTVINCVRSIGCFKMKKPHYVCPWHLAKISHLSIVYSNDFRGDTVTTKDILLLSHLCWESENEHSKKYLEKKIDRTIWFEGHTQVQFWYQRVMNLLACICEALRLELLLCEIPKRRPVSSIPDYTKTILEKEYGMSYRSYIESVLCILFMALQRKTSVYTPINVLDSVKEVFPDIDTRKVARVVDMLTGDYAYFRGESHDEAFLEKPIVESTKGRKRIISSIYLLARLITEGPYWIIRNYYAAHNDREFTSNFGKLFELYLEECFQFYYLPEHKYKRLPDSSGLADWWVFPHESTVIAIEQKSTLMSVKLKTAYPNPTKYEEHVRAVYGKALVQLNRTREHCKQEYPEKTFVGIVLHWEHLYTANDLLRCFAATISNTDKTGIFFADISEFEILIQLIACQPDQYIALEKQLLEYDRGIAKPGEGHSFGMMYGRLRIPTISEFIRKRLTNTPWTKTLSTVLMK